MVRIEKMSLEECVDLHYNMWEYIAQQEEKIYRNKSEIDSEMQENIRFKLKEEYCDMLIATRTINKIPENSCFMCQYAYNEAINKDKNCSKRLTGGDYCKYCPAIWGTEDTDYCFFCESGEDGDYEENTIDYRYSNANDIAEIKIKSE